MIAIILAGGSGTRFWPLSRRARPKQLLPLWGDKPMLAETLERLAPQVPADRAIIVCGAHLKEGVQEALPDLPPGQILIEPAARNTMPALALAAVAARRTFPGELLGIFPSDHHIAPPEALQACVAYAAERARDGAIATMGIPPTRPETGFGYLRVPEAPPRDGVVRHVPVEAFVEKPDQETALRYLQGGRHLWNSGMFIMSTETFFAELERQQPETHALFARLDAAWETPERDAVMREVFEQAPSTSIDYAIMEGARRVEVVPATFTWSDVGHWRALEEVAEADDAGNVATGDVLALETTGSILHATGGRVVAALGLEDLIVVDTPDAVMVLPKERAQDVRAIVAALRERSRQDLL